MKIKQQKILRLSAAVFAALLALTLTACNGTEQPQDISAQITDLLAEDYNLSVTVSTDDISSNYGYRDADDNDYENYLGAVLWLDTADDAISCTDGKYQAADMAAYQASLPPYEEITRAVGGLLADAGFHNYSVEFYHQLSIADGKTMANTATLLNLDSYENYSAINPILDSLNQTPSPDKIIGSQPLQAADITAFIVDNYEFNVSAITCEGEGEDYQITLELTENRGDFSAVTDWSAEDYAIWQMRVDTVNYSVYEIYQFLNETHNVQADITVNIGGHKGNPDDYDPAAWFSGHYTTADPQNLGSLHCTWEDKATEAYNAAKGVNFPTGADTVNRIF